MTKYVIGVKQLFFDETICLHKNIVWKTNTWFDKNNSFIHVSRHHQNGLTYHTWKCVKPQQTKFKHDTLLLFVANLLMSEFGLWVLWLSWTVVSNTSHLSHASNKVPSAKWSHEPKENTIVGVRNQLPNWICKPRFSPSPPFVFSVQLTHFNAGVLPICTMDRID